MPRPHRIPSGTIVDGRSYERDTHAKIVPSRKAARRTPVPKSRIMGHGDVIGKHPTGPPSEQIRRKELLQPLLGAFDRGGAEAVPPELRGLFENLERPLDGRLQALNANLSKGIPPC